MGAKVIGGGVWSGRGPGGVGMAGGRGVRVRLSPKQIENLCTLVRFEIHVHNFVPRGGHISESEEIEAPLPGHIGWLR